MNVIPLIVGLLIFTSITLLLAGETIGVLVKQNLPYVDEWVYALNENALVKLCCLGLESILNKFSRDRFHVVCSIEHLIAVFAAISLLLLALTKSLAGAFISVIATIALLFLRGKKAQQELEQEIGRALPELIKKMSMALESGLSLEKTLYQVAPATQPQLKTALEKSAHALSYGMSQSQALQLISKEFPYLDLKLLQVALEVSKVTGAPLNAMLNHVVKLLKSRERLKKTLLVKTAQTRLSATIVGVLPIAMMMVLMGLSSDYRAGLSSVAGVWALSLAFVLDGVAIFLMHRIVGEVA